MLELGWSCDGAGLVLCWSRIGTVLVQGWYCVEAGLVL